MSQSDRLYIFQKKHDKNVKYVFKFVNKGEKIVYTIHEKIRLVAITERRKHMESIYSVANYFLSKEPMTHKKLQKMCYFAQAWHMANYDSPLVPNRFEAWVHGPVSPDLYSKYRGWGWETIPQCKERVFFESESIPKFLDQVYEVYGGYDADQLESITHAEEPWKKARNGCSIGAYSRNPISLIEMRNYYGERIGKKYAD